MPENRYHELLGLSPDISQPDYFQLLLLTPDTATPDMVETHFKEQMTKLQLTKSNKHKEFIEYLKGEIKNARKILTDPNRKKDYIENLRQDRAGELKKYLSLLLVDKALSAQAETLLLNQAQSIGLSRIEATHVINEELKRAGARRVKSKAEPTSDERAVMQKLQRYADAWREAKLEAKVAEEKLRETEQMQEELEELERSASIRERRAAALATDFSKRQQDLMIRFKEAQKGLVVKAQELIDKERQLMSLQEDLEKREFDLARSLHRRSAIVSSMRFYLLLIVLFILTQVVPLLLPDHIREPLQQTLQSVWLLNETWTSLPFFAACGMALILIVMAVVSFFWNHPVIGNMFLVSGLGVFALVVVHIVQNRVAL